MKELDRRLKLLTPQEHLFIGSDSVVEPRNDSEWYIPECVTRGETDIGHVIRGRRDIGHIETSIMAAALGIKSKSLIMRLQELDPKTGQTIADPEIIGIWDGVKKEIIGDSRDLTKELLGKLCEDGTELHLRQSEPVERQKAGIEGR